MVAEGLNCGQNSHCVLLAVAQNRGKVEMARSVVVGGRRCLWGMLVVVGG